MDFRKIKILIVTVLLLLTSPIYSQNTINEDLLDGFFIRGGQILLNKELLMHSDESTEIWINQKNSPITFGVGYDYIPHNEWYGFGGSVSFCNTKLNSFSYTDAITTDVLAYKDISYSFLFFDCNFYLLPIENIPFAFTLGFTLDGSFHSYNVSGDKSTFSNVNGKQSFNIFRYGYILGCKVIPFKFLSIELEYRPMASYSVTQSYTLGDYAYTEDGVDWYYIKDKSEKEGDSESMFYFGISIHF
ncbi:MAG: hypothetical protein NTZ27_12075 [Ignavibacteriales bacterium]|nr:hypothetical protein [Ignavibacteriales bacterium]